MTSKSRILEREKKWTLPAGIAAIVGVVLFFVGQRVAQSSVGPSDSSAQLFESIAADTSSTILGGVLSGLGMALLAIPLVFLFLAALARSDRMRRGFVAVAIIGPLFLGVGTTLTALSVTSAAEKWDGDATPGVAKCFEDEQQELGAGEELTEDQRDDCRNEVATDLRRNEGSANLAGGIALSGALGFLIGLFYTAMHAMRAGLLTRFWGSLGMAVGVLLVLPLLNFLAMAWFVFLGMLLAGWVPGGRPPAWAAGEAVPWPVPGQSDDDSDDGVIEGTADELEPGALDAGDDHEALNAEDLPAPGERRKRKKRD